MLYKIQNILLFLYIRICKRDKPKITGYKYTRKTKQVQVISTKR